ncbi:hypothetical protein E4U31_002727 [Claviceps sp. LM219 group G6]|nr:hypothetical protein E4U31_002727 [Claviceps sp. LM219 group G6]
MSRRTDYNLAGCPRYQYLSPRVLPHHRVYVLNKTQVHRLHSSQNAVNHRYAPRAKAFESAINLPRQRRRLFGATTRPCRQGIPAQIPPHLPSSRAVGLDVTIW